MTATVESFDITDSTVNIASSLAKITSVDDMSSNDKFIGFVVGQKAIVARIHLPP